MFWTVYNDSEDSPFPWFISVEGDTREEAANRLQWFGIDVFERCSRGYDKWMWNERACGTPLPMWGRTDIRNCGLLTGGRMVIFQNNNLWSSPDLLTRTFDEEVDETF